MNVALLTSLVASSLKPQQGGICEKNILTPPWGDATVVKDKTRTFGGFSRLIICRASRPPMLCAAIFVRYSRTDMRSISTNNIHTFAAGFLFNIITQSSGSFLNRGRWRYRGSNDLDIICSKSFLDTTPITHTWKELSEEMQLVKTKESMRLAFPGQPSFPSVPRLQSNEHIETRKHWVFVRI